MVSQSTGRIVPARCNSHLCPDCAGLHRLTAQHAIRTGVYRSRLAANADVSIFLTLTEPSRAALDLPGLHRRWSATRQRLRRVWGMTEYALVVELQERGALHPHVFATVPAAVAGDLVDRRTRASYRRRMHELRPLAESLGWGQMVDAVTVQLPDADRMAAYGAKRLAGYATKQARAKFRELGAERVRPVRLSRGWVPGGLKRAREAVLGQTAMDRSRDPGPWLRTRSVAC